MATTKKLDEIPGDTASGQVPEAAAGDIAGSGDAKDVAKDTAKVQIRRVAGVDPVCELSYTPIRTPEMANQAHSGGLAHWQPDPSESVFEVSADIASAAVASGAFEVTDASRVKLKGGS